MFLRDRDQLAGVRALVRNRGSQFVDAFGTEGLKILRTPVRTPVANAERWIGSIRRDLLDRTIIWNQRLVIDYVDHYNLHRPHRAPDQRPPLPADPR